MADKITVPVFDTDRSIEAYTQEVEAWRLVTGHCKEKQAIVLVLALKEDLRTQIWNNITREDLNKEDVVNTYINFLTNNYGKDDLIDS